MKRGGFVAAALAGSLALAGAAGAAYHEGPMGGGQQNAAEKPAAHVDAAGNPFTGGLAFDPAEVAIEVTDVVEWTNTDSAVPHTATEDHMLWRLSGDYGDPAGAFPKGFGPGETVSRDFDAGTFSYYCEVHPEDMRGVVKVPVTLRERKQLLVRWGSGPLPEGQVFDVQRQATRSGRSERRTGKWRTVIEGTTEQRAAFGYGPADVTKLAFRARVRDSANPEAVSGWSPPEVLTLD